MKCLDRQRLNSQRREALHILKVSLGMSNHYKSHKCGVVQKKLSAYMD
jgi:hypothetical protein